MQKTVEPTAMQNIESAYIMINCEFGAESSVIEQLKSIPSIKEVLGVFGNYDVLVKIQAPSAESLRNIITFQIRKNSTDLLYYNNNVFKDDFLV